MDFFGRTKLCPSRCYLTFFHIPERSIALVNDWLVHQKLKLIPTPTLTKVLLQGSTRILIYIDGLLSVAPNCAQAAILPSSIFERSIALVKLAGSPKELKLIPTCPTLTKCSKVAHAFLYTLMDFFQSHQPARRCYLTFFHIPERSIALVKRLAGSKS
jgi:hypothetical protein